jgi:tripartite-type tricarboxylate transporter receptor subunit TctC
MVAPEFLKATGRTAIIDNKSGANSIIGTSIVAKAKGDGNTLVVGTSAMTLNHAFSAKGTAPALPYDTAKDLNLISLFGVAPYLLVVNSDSEYKNVNDLIKKAKQGGKPVSYASSGTGGSPHLGGLLLSQATQTDLLHVPYRGSGPAMTAVLGKDVDFTFASYAAAKPFVDSGKMRAIAIASKERASFLPNVLTYEEQGIKNAEVDSWFGLLAPASTPAKTKQELHQVLNKIMMSPEMGKRLYENGIIFTPMNLEKLEQFYQNDIRQWEVFIREFKGKME